MVLHRDSDGILYHLTILPNVSYSSKIDLLEMECISQKMGYQHNLAVSPLNSKGRIKTVYFKTEGCSILLGEHKKGWAYTNLAGTRILESRFCNKDSAEKAAYLAGYEIMR